MVVLASGSRVEYSVEACGLDPLEGHGIAGHGDAGSGIAYLQGGTRQVRTYDESGLE